MPSLASISRLLVRPPPRRLLAAFTAAAALCVAPRAANAQTTLSHTEDAAPISAGSLRFRVINGWTRFDERFGIAGRTPLGADFSTDSLGPRQLPLLLPIEDALKTLSGDPQRRLTLGRLETRSDARIVTTPIALEYGVTRRLSVGVLIPIVQTRRALQLVVNRDSTGNVTFVPVRNRRSASLQNAAVYAQFRSAADSLATLIARCPVNPTAAGCAAVNANATDAAAVRTQVQRFADAVQSAFGTDSTNAFIAPRAGSTLAAAIEAQRAALSARIRTYLGATAATGAGVFTSSGSFSYIDLNGRNAVPGLLQSSLGGGLDSLRTTERIGLGDVSVGAQFLVFDRFDRAADVTPRAVQSRLAVGGAIRFVTSRADSAKNLADIGTGDGAGLEVHSAMDVMSGRFGGTVAARYLKYTSRPVNAPLRGDPDAFFPVPVFGAAMRTSGDVIGLDFTPRFFLGEWFSLNGLYGIERSGGASYDRTEAFAACSSCVGPAVFNADNAHTAQRLGLGVRFSTVDAYLRGRSRYPIEVSLSHLESIADAAGAPVLRRDVIQLRLFYRIRR